MVKPLNEDELKKLLNQRSSFISIKGKIASVIEPKQFQLMLENIANVRNIIVVCAALATIGMLTLAEKAFQLPYWPKMILFASVIFFLVAAILYSYYLRQFLGDGIKSYKKQMQDSVDVANRGEQIINDRLDLNISSEEAESKLQDVYKDIEFEQVRTKPKPEEKFDFSRIIGAVANWSYVLGMTALIAALISLSTCSVTPGVSQGISASACTTIPS